jgi:hypothetical protein
MKNVHAEGQLHSLTASILRAQKVRLLALDVDGVLTDGGLYISEDGKPASVSTCRTALPSAARCVTALSLRF